MAWCRYQAWATRIGGIKRVTIYGCLISSTWGIINGHTFLLTELVALSAPRKA